MAYNVRIFGYSGIVQVQQRLVKQYNADSVFLLDDPYLWSQKLVIAEGGGIATPSVVVVADKATVLYIQCPDGKQVRYEFNPNGPTASNARIAGDLSPRISGFAQLPWAAGASISLADAAFFL